MAFVLDASIAACWAFPDERHPTADLAFAEIDADEAIVPSLWWYEVRNMLVVNEGRGRITERDTNAFLRSLNAFFIRTDRLPEEAAECERYGIGVRYGQLFKGAKPAPLTKPRPPLGKFEPRNCQRT